MTDYNAFRWRWGRSFWQVLGEWSGADTSTPLDSCAAVSALPQNVPLIHFFRPEI